MKLRRISVLLSIKDRFLPSDQQAISQNSFKRCFIFQIFSFGRTKRKEHSRGSDTVTAKH